MRNPRVTRWLVRLLAVPAIAVGAELVFGWHSHRTVVGFLPVPNGVLILFLVAIVISFVLANTALGRYTFALGSNEEAVRLSGVNIDRWKIAVYVLAGGVVGVAGLPRDAHPDGRFADRVHDAS